MKSSPIPSTSHEPGSTFLPSLTSGARIEPTGSARIISHFGLRSFRYLPTPLTVPPEPMPATNASILPSICSQISGPVVS